MIVRLRRYIAGGFPPAFYLPYTLTWALGGTAMFALDRRGAPTWRPGWSTPATAATLTVLVLIMRIVDDLRDLEYDREHNPGRPLASGAVSVPDLTALCGAGIIAVLLLSSGRGDLWAAAIAPVAYAALLLAADRLLHWPPGDAVIIGSLTGLPVQLLVDLYLYAALLHDTGHTAGLDVFLPLAAMLAVFCHLEFARKATRVPQPGERGYATSFGVQPTAIAALAAVIVATLLALALTRPWMPGSLWGWIVIVPAALAARGATRFWRGRAARWPLSDAGLYVLAAFTAFFIVDLAERHTP